ncbi:hypothetical protein BE20_27630 [Sorangium cellulosum]|nr:hypothetical protein BE20_27630 [Sorangium cellulosum]
MHATFHAGGAGAHGQAAGAHGQAAEAPPGFAEIRRGPGAIRGIAPRQFEAIRAITLRPRGAIPRSAPAPRSKPALGASQSRVEAIYPRGARVLFNDDGQ